MFSYLAFVCGGINAPSQSPDADGVEMAEKCLRQLEETGNPEQFPPRLLILLISPAYDEAAAIKQMISGIRRTIAEYKKGLPAEVKGEPVEVQLIGSSVEAVLFNREIHKRGALLVCLASRLIDAEIQVTTNLRDNWRDNWEEIADDLLKKLGLSLQEEDSRIQRPLTDRLLLAFFPNIGRHDRELPYLAPELHRRLQQNARFRTPVVGGVSSRPGFQFANDEVYHNELVAARIYTGAPFSSSFGHGLKETSADLRVKNLAPDSCTVLKFDQRGSPARILGLKKHDDVALLGELSLDRDPFVTLAQLASDGKSVKLLRKVKDHALFRKLAITDPDHARSAERRIFEDSLQWWMVERPVGCLAIHCSSRLRAGLDVKAFAEDAEEVMRKSDATPEINSDNTYFGGFFDGEIGTYRTGHTVFGNWCIATLGFSDEMRERTPAHTGFKAISETAPALISISSLDGAIDRSLEMIFETGFPGAMLSVVMENEDGEWLVALGAIGSRFGKIWEMTKRPLNGEDVLAKAARAKKPEFIADSRQDDRCDPKAIAVSGIISQYILPLFDRQENLIAVLQFDLGDLRRRKSGLYEAEERILQSLGTVVGATILRVLNRQEADLARGLDEALKESIDAAELSQALQIYIEKAARHFRVEMGHIRLLNRDEDALEMVAGAGEYYEEFKSLRWKTKIKSDSPTALAFVKDSKVVVNDSERNHWQQSLLKSCRDNPSAYDALNNARSFANAPIRDGDGNPIGTISLISVVPWFFTRPRVRAMDALSQRVGYLIEHFKAQKERKFLLDISSDFVRGADFKHPVRTINETVGRFRKAANAEIASLFIFDKETGKFVLRAQDGWADDKWVDAARYKEGERWTGSVALGEGPQYLPDLFAYKKERGFPSYKEYETHIFGEPLSESFTAEAIGLPLRLKQDQTIGVLTLFRRIRTDPNQPRKISGFTTINLRILQEAADTLSAELSALLYNQRMVWLKAELKRHEAVREALEDSASDSSPEQRLCDEMVESFHARRAVLYLTMGDTKLAGLFCAASASRREGANLTPSEPDETVIRAALEKKIQEKRKQDLPDKEWRAPELAKTEGLVERVALPLLNGERLVGVLDLCFGTKRKHSHLISVHDPDQLQELARKIAPVFQRQKELEQKAEAEAQARRSGLAMQAMGAMVFQTAHRLMNLTQNIYAMSILIEAANSEQERRAKMTELFQMINSAKDNIKRPMDIARRMKDIRPQPFNLHSLIAEALLELDIRRYLSAVEIREIIPENLIVVADRDLIREAFRNVIHNAMNAMPNGGAFTINASWGEDRRTAQVAFIDEGVGMSKERIRAALSGFVASRSGTGLGILASRLLLRAQNGDLGIVSNPGEGTKVIVTLPTVQEESL